MANNGLVPVAGYELVFLPCKVKNKSTEFFVEAKMIKRLQNLQDLLFYFGRNTSIKPMDSNPPHGCACGGRVLSYLKTYFLKSES